MASSLRPTPETGRVAATRQPASAIGPSWSQRGSREARLAFRQAQKRGDREGAMRIAAQAEEQGYASQASIGSAEERLAGQYQGRQADTAITTEIGTALTPPGPGRADGQPDKIMTPAGERNAPRGGVQELSSQTPAGAGFNRGGMLGMVMDSARQNPVFREKVSAARAAYERIKDGGIDPKTGRALIDESEVGPPIPEAPTVPGASQPPENPVTGSSVPATGDAEARLGIRKPGRINGMPADKAIGEAQTRVDAIPGRAPTKSFDEQFAEYTGATSESAPQGSSEDESGFLDGVSRLTTPEGGDLTRKAAVEEMNRLRRAAGQTPADVEQTLGALLARDRSASQERARINTLRITDRPPTARTAPTPTPAPSRASLVGGSPAARPTPLAPTAGSAAYRLGQAARQLSPASIAGRVAANSRDVTRGVGMAAAGAAVQGVRQVQGAALDVAGVAAAPIVDARNRVAEFAGDQVITGLRRRRRLADFVRGIRTPQS